MDTKDLKDVISSLSKMIDDNEKIYLPLFSTKLAKAAEAYPEDYTVGMMNTVVARMSGSKSFISRSELKELYNRLYSRNTKFAEVFGDELGEVNKLATPKLYNRDNESGIVSFDEETDSSLKSALDVAFGNETKAYSTVAGERAKDICSNLLTNASIDIVSGDENCIVCRASFETPKGKTSFYIPIEVFANKALSPSTFVGNDGPEDLTKSNVESYVVANAGKTLDISVSDVKPYASKVDFVLAKLNSQKKVAVASDEKQSLYDSILEEKEGLVNAQDYKDQEIESFASKFGSARGNASLVFGEATVNLGRKVIASKLNDCGFKHCQVSVCGNDDKSISYAVSINAQNLAFKVPVKVVDSKVIEPSIVIASGIVESFSKDGLRAIMSKGATDNKAAAIASPLHELKASDLINTVREAMEEENLSKAEDALNVLAQNGDEKAYQVAMLVYTNGLSGNKEKVASKCSMIVRNANSKYDVCGHTNLPLHKVYQDKQGNCLPEYRKGMSESYDGASFMHSKVLL